jgi:hypothetical protein
MMKQRNSSSTHNNSFIYYLLRLGGLLSLLFAATGTATKAKQLVSSLFSQDQENP